MAVYDLEEQEQISEIKAWWEQYGKIVTALALTAALASVGWQGLKWYQDKQAAEASALYYAVQQAVEGGDAARAREAAGQIIEHHAKSAYAEMAALMSANAQFAAGDHRNARAHLEWLRSNTKDPVLRDLARLRLAAVMIAEGSTADALAQLDGAPAPSLKARFEDLRGDVLAMDSRPDEAAAAYNAALDALNAAGGSEGTDALMEVIRVKLESLES